MSLLNDYRLCRRSTGEIFTFLELGISSCQIQRDRFGRAQMSLTVERGRSDPYSLVPLQRYDLLPPAGPEVLFSGWFTSPSMRLSGNSEQHSYILMGPWWLLERFTYEFFVTIQDPNFLGLVESRPSTATRAGHQSGLLFDSATGEFTKASVRSQINLALQVAGSVEPPSRMLRMTCPIGNHLSRAGG